MCLIGKARDESITVGIFINPKCIGPVMLVDLLVSRNNENEHVISF